MFPRSLILALCVVALVGCVTGSRFPTTMCRFVVPSPWSPWRELLGAPVTFELENGARSQGEVTRVEFFPSTEIRIRIQNSTECVTLSFDQARSRLLKAEYSKARDWGRFLGKYVSVGSVEGLVTTVLLEPEPAVVVMEETEDAMQYSTVLIAEVLASSSKIEELGAP